jgi:hypothetical protein
MEEGKKQSSHHCWWLLKNLPEVDYCISHSWRAVENHEKGSRHQLRIILQFLWYSLVFTLGSNVVEIHYGVQSLQGVTYY